jgi:Tfp pilus assembly protein PilF
MSIKTERLLNRAKKLFKKGEIIKARDLYSTVLKSSPNNIEAKKGLNGIDNNENLNTKKNKFDEVMRHYSSGQMNEALLGIADLIKDYPNDSLLFNVQGACYSEIGLNDSAITSFKNAIAIKPNYAEAHFNLGVAYQKLLDFDNSSKCYEIAISINHAYPTAHNNLGLIFLNQKLLSEAKTSFEWAIAYNPEYSEGHNSLGAVCQELKKFNSAKKHFEKAVILNPRYAQAFHNLGILCEIINLPDEALAHYENAVSINPWFAEAFRNLSRIKKYTSNDPQIRQIELFHSKSGINTSDKIKLCFTLAKINNDLGDIDAYFKYLNEGNKLRKHELNYSFDQSKNFHSVLIDFFNSSQPVIKKKNLKPSQIKPIFIVGMPRSGTSLVEQIISNHSSVYGAGELLALREIVSPIVENHINKNEKTFLEKDILSIRSQYLDELSNLNTSEKIITDKMPMNFRLIGFILCTFPEAKIIHLKRDAIATCWSNYKTYFTSGNGFSFDQEDLASFYNLYSELMDYWHKLYPNKIYDLNYEELTKNQKDETQKLLDYCELEWDENCLNFHTNKRGVQTASSNQVRQKIYQGSSEAWKQYETYLEPMIQGLSNF